MDDAPNIEPGKGRLVYDKAHRTIVATREPRRPTVAELEELLKCEDDAQIEIRPDGSIIARVASAAAVGSRSWPDPTPEMLDNPLFNAIWETIKAWDIAVPGAYCGYCGASGNHARAIYDAIHKRC